MLGAATIRSRATIFRSQYRPAQWAFLFAWQEAGMLDRLIAQKAQDRLMHV